MSQVVTGVTQKLQDLMPDQIGTNRRWSTTALERYIMLADRAVRERTENLESSQTIPLVANTIEYALDSEFIDVFAVEFAADGSTYDYYLKPATLDDLDMISLSWRDDGGTRPDYYCLVGAPGTPTSTILIHRKMTSVDAQTIRVWGHRVGATTTTVPDDVQRAAHVPYVMAMLKAGEDPREAAMWYGRFINGCEEVSRRTVSRYAAGFMNVDVGY